MAVRTFAARVATASLVTGLIVGVTAAPAVASSDEITSPAEHAVIASGPSVQIAAELDLAEKAKLRLRGPSDEKFHTVDEGRGDLAYRLDVSCPDYAGPCSGDQPAPNGTYAVRVVDSGLVLSGDVEDAQTFRLRVPPRRPHDLSVRPLGADAVRLRWHRGAESDLTAYDVANSSGARVKRVSLGPACAGGSCSTVARVPAHKRGKQVAYSLRARRATAPGSGRTVASAPSEMVAVQLPAPARPPSPGATGHGGDGHTDRAHPPVVGASSQPWPTPARGTLPKLQPLASSSRLALPDIARQSNDMFKRRLDYRLPMLPAPTPQPGGASGGVKLPALDSAQGEEPPRSMTAAVGMSPSEWWKTVALGLVLLLVAAHLGAWTWSTRPEPPRVSRAQTSRVPATALATDESSVRARTGGALAGRRRGRRRARKRG